MNLPKPVATCGWGGQIEHLHEGPKSLLVGADLYTRDQMIEAVLVERERCLNLFDKIFRDAINKND